MCELRNAQHLHWKLHAYLLGKQQWEQFQTKIKGRNQFYQNQA